MSKALGNASAALLAICLISFSLSYWLQGSEQEKLQKSDVLHFNFGIWNLVSSQPKLNRHWQLFFMPIDSGLPNSSLETKTLSMPEVERNFLLNNETTQSSVPNYSAYEASGTRKAIGKIVIVERIQEEFVALPGGSCGYLFVNADKTRHEIVIGPFGSSMVLEALRGASSNGLSSTLEVFGVVEGANTKLVFSQQGKTKVPGTVNETDAVKPESKSPE